MPTGPQYRHWIDTPCQARTTATTVAMAKQQQGSGADHQNGDVNR